MKISINVICRKDKMYKNNTAPIHVRFTLNRQTRYVSTGVAISPNDWNFDEQRINPSLSHLKEAQYKIDTVLSEYERKIIRLEALEIAVTFDTLFETNGRRVAITVEDGFRNEIARLEALGKYSSAVKHKSALLALNSYKSTKIALEAVDMDYLKGFELFLRERRNNDNSIATRFAIFKAIYNKAVKEGHIVPKQNPFVQYKVGSLWTKTRKRAIDKDDIRKIAELEIPHNYKSSYKQLARDMFLFSYLTAGMNFCDIARLRYRDVMKGRVYYSRHKTQKLLSCRLSEQADGIIERYTTPSHNPEDYIFPILDRAVHITDRQIFHRIVKVLRKVNSALKDIGGDVGLLFPLTTYVARHTYATVLKRSGVNIAIISESLGHSDLATTQIYLDSFENSQIDEAMKNLL
jgi:integrase